MESSRTGAGWAPRGVLSPAVLVVAAMPPLLVAQAVVHYWVDLPFWDQWRLVPLLGAARDGGVSLADLWSQHNEHRLVLPRITMLGLARLTGWDVRVEMVANLVIALGTLLVLMALIRRTVRPLAPALVPLLTVLASCLVFSLSQADNWVWGWQIQIYLNTLITVGAAWCLSGRDFAWRRTGVLALAGIAALLSFGAGVVMVALLPAAVLFAPWSLGRRGHLVRVVMVAALGAGLVGLYFVDFHLTPNQPKPALGFGAAPDLVRYVLAYVGAGLNRFDPVAAVRWGLVGLIMLSLAATWLWVKSPRHRAAMFPWLFLATYAVLNGALTSVVRVGFGVGQALTGRYVTITALFWISVAVVVALWAGWMIAEGNLSRAGVFGLVAILALVGMLAARSYAGSWSFGRRAMRAHRDSLRTARRCVMRAAMAPDECLQRVYFDPAFLRLQVVTLRRLGMGPMRSVGHTP